MSSETKDGRFCFEGKERQAFSASMIFDKEYSEEKNAPPKCPDCGGDMVRAVLAVDLGIMNDPTYIMGIQRQRKVVEYPAFLCEVSCRRKTLVCEDVGERTSFIE